jgi:para-nitrobenzyl esterase
MGPGKLIGVLLVGLALAGCTWVVQPEGPAAEEGAMSGLLDVTWVWQETQAADGSVIAPDDPTHYTLRLAADGTAAVQLDCNQGGGSYNLEGDSLTFSPMVSTLIGCPEGSLGELFGQQLSTVSSYSLEEDSLTLHSEAGTMRFTRAAAPETTPAPAEEAMQNPLVDATWQWQGTLYGDDTRIEVQDPARYTLTFLPDGTLAAQVDCNRGRGSYTLDGSTLTFGPLTTTRMACPADSQAGGFLENLAAVKGYVLEGDTLTLALQLDTGTMTFVKTP